MRESSPSNTQRCHVTCVCFVLYCVASISPGSTNYSSSLIQIIYTSFHIRNHFRILSRTSPKIGEKQRTTTSYRASWSWAMMACLIVSEIYIHNCEHFGPIAMRSWRMTESYRRATGSSCQQVYMLRPWQSYTDHTTCTCSLVCVLEWNQPWHWGCWAQVCNVPTNVASATHATRDPFATCLSSTVRHKMKGWESQWSK